MRQQFCVLKDNHCDRNLLLLLLLLLPSSITQETRFWVKGLEMPAESETVSKASHSHLPAG
jgi:hypothetical protein